MTQAEQLVSALLEEEPKWVFKQLSVKKPTWKHAPNEFHGRVANAPMTMLTMEYDHGNLHGFVSASLDPVEEGGFRGSIYANAYKPFPGATASSHWRPLVIGRNQMLEFQRQVNNFFTRQVEVLFTEPQTTDRERWRVAGQFDRMWRKLIAQFQ